MHALLDGAMIMVGPTLIEHTIFISTNYRELN